MDATPTTDRSTALPDERTLAATVTALVSLLDVKAP
jgi:hypothetical protein